MKPIAVSSQSLIVLLRILIKLLTPLFPFSAPIDIGPGSYLLDQAQLKEIEKFKPVKYPPKETNWASVGRFQKPAPQTSTNLGPGVYNDVNKWNKRTYNLKFLNN